MKYTKKDQKEFLKFFDEENQGTISNEVNNLECDELTNAVYKKIRYNKKLYGDYSDLEQVVAVNVSITDFVKMYKECLQTEPNDILKSLLQKE